VKKEKKKDFCVVKIELLIYIDYKFQGYQVKNDWLGTERKRTQGFRVQFLEPFSIRIFSNLSYFGGYVKKKR
jgi:hypothetical protein